MNSKLQINNNATNAFLLDGNGGAARLDPDNLTTWQPDDGFLWVHLDYTSTRDQVWLKETSGLNELVVSALLAEETRPRTTAIENGLLIALRGVNLVSDSDPEDMVAIRIWIDNHRVITTRKRNLESVTDIVNDLSAGRGPANAAEFIASLTDRLVWRSATTIEMLEDQVAELEERLIDANDSSMRYELATLRRQAITLRRYLAPQRDALARLIVEKVSWLDDDNRLHIREVSDRLIRQIEDLDAVRERAAVTQEELLSRLSEQLNSRIYVLSIVAAIFLPLSFLTGLLGINVGGIPGANYAPAFWIFTGILVCVIVLQLILFRRKKWL